MTNMLTRRLNGGTAWPSLFDDFFRDLAYAPSGQSGWMPGLDVVETPDALIVKADLPGVDPAKVDLSIEGEYLQIKGERVEERTEGEHNWRRCERRQGSFVRTLELPFPVEADRIEAKFHHGVLTVTLPKREEVRPRKIKIKAE